MNIKSYKGKGIVCGKSHDAIITEFVDKYFISVTDNGKVGTMVEVSFEKNISNDTISLATKVRFGKDEPEVHSVAQSIVEVLKLNKPVVFAFSAKEYDSTTAVSITQLVSNTLLQNKKENVPDQNVSS